MSWRDEDDDEPKDWEEIEPEEEKGDRHPTLGGTAPLARVVFAAILLAVVLGGVLALVRGVGSWLER
ncbi:hypothetical protein ASA1KI_07530 [Opitutales bacterium ASA1]|uniref:hypothetical protein n=1 Tax=Congregicoccus parvus TaxID=3081749 RepID=UPI002B280B18|nr:hypothetical protein ASA1KI_07530 [Opitutales bacterium ASA1]